MCNNVVKEIMISKPHENWSSAFCCKKIVLLPNKGIVHLQVLYENVKLSSLL